MYHVETRAGICCRPLSGIYIPDIPFDISVCLTIYQVLYIPVRLYKIQHYLVYFLNIPKNRTKQPFVSAFRFLWYSLYLGVFLYKFYQLSRLYFAIYLREIYNPLVDFVPIYRNTERNNPEWNTESHLW